MKQHKIKTRAEYIVTALAVIAVFALVNYLGNRFFFRLDLTENKQFTVSDATRRILRNLDDIVTVNAFFSRNLPPETHLVVNSVRDILAEYQSIAGGRLRVVWEDPTSDPETAARAQSLGIPDITLQTARRDQIEVLRGYMGVAISYAGRRETIPVVQNLNTLEYDLTRAIMRVIQQTRPRVGILRAQSADFVPHEFLAQMNMNHETTEMKFGPLRQSLQEDYDVVIVDVSGGEPIDQTIRTLIIPGGQNFSDRAVFEIDQFVMRGGNLIALASGVHIGMSQMGMQATVNEAKILELLEHYGVRVERNMVMDVSCSRVQVPIQIGMFTMHDLMPYPYFVMIYEGTGGFADGNPAVSAQPELMLAWSASLTSIPQTLEAHGATAARLVSSSERSWHITENFDLSPRPEYVIPSEDEFARHALAYHISGTLNSFFAGKSIPRANEEDTTAMSMINLASDSDREIINSASNAHVVIVGSTEFIGAQYASRPNMNFVMNLVDWLSLDNNLITVRTRVLSNKAINQNILDERSGMPGFIRWFNLLFMPIVVAVVGVVISLKRREERDAPPVSQSQNQKRGNV